MSAIVITRGSDKRFEISFSDENNAPLPLLDNSEVVIFDEGKLRGRFTGQITDAATGKVAVDFAGSDPAPVGTYRFRVQVTRFDGKSVGTPLIRFKIV